MACYSTPLCALRSLLTPALGGLLIAAALAWPQNSRAEALLVIEADTGKVLQAENATYPWYPASITKIMTAYLTLKAVKEGRVTLDTLLTVSPNAVAQPPTKMGFKSGIQLTVDNALKMMMVKSANDIAVVLAEGLAGSIDNFANEMNRAAQRLGMSQSHFVNPNGLPAEGHVSSARDLGILARAVIRELPEYDSYFHLPGIKFGRRVTANYNKLIGRYPGADGMKTGFICASGFNLLATATRGNKRLIAVVLGAPSSAQRAVKAAQILERGFNGNRLAWLRPSLGTVDALAPIDASPPDLRDEMCGPKRKRPAAEDEDDEDIQVNAETENTSVSMFAAGLQPPSVKASELLASAATLGPPVIVYTGPTRTGAAVLAADAAETEKQMKSAKGKRGAKSKIAAKPVEKPDAKSAAKPTDAAGAKAAANSDKPKAAAVAAKSDKKPDPTAKPDSKPAKGAATPAPKPTAKGTAKDGAKSTAKPAAQSKG